ncbi:hypothetical protein CU102_03200 [Phyllobacterium brassicacearum]|uniref:Uncharacterized protein n=1 Tax=Phyllobacterium brassicacearum TaxID=314235 RepID=A0A2P7BUH0_9HYPH|nr:hypothetical protein [Phyllobacterium brassicacearum]PSH70119.1 hypothetical protein CU102_03200 [Phyllobacterium brassicacearum]
MEITWKPIHLDARNNPDEFVAIASDIVIGRIYRICGGPKHGNWYFNFQLGRRPFRTSAMNGVVSKRKTAQQRVLQLFIDFLATPSDDGGGKSGAPSGQ